MKKSLFVFLFLISAVGFAQQQEELKVGLVLSGGGAKGLAHIGALKILEEAGIKIHYIGGTSMGAIVGGLYASGYTAQQLDSLFAATNFNNIIQDDLPREAKTFYEREDAEKYAITLPFNDFKVSFPSGLSKGQNLYNLMSRLLGHVSNVQDFSKLPIPFFAVATNIENGKEVILDEGSLAEAVSASGALPSIFSPVIIDGKLLTDGGVVNNFPVDIMMEKDVDVIIGVDVQDSLAKRKNLNSIFEILSQISNFRTTGAMEVKKGLADVYIKPNISNFSALSFEKGESIIDSGRVAALSKMEALRKIAKLQKAKVEERKPIVPDEILHIAGVEVNGLTTYPRSYILGKLQIKSHETMTYDELNLRINNLSATGNFKRITHKLVPVEEGYRLELEVTESENTTMLRLAAHYDNLFKSGVLLNLTQKRLLLTNDITSLDLVIGDNFRYNFEYYIDKGYYWSVGLRSRLIGFDKNVGYDFVRETLPEDPVINKLSVEYLDITNQFYVETLFKKYFSLGLGAEHKYLHIQSETIENDAASTASAQTFENDSYYSGFGYLKLDTFDNYHFPTKGVLFNADFHLYLFSSSFNEVLAGFSVAKASATYAYSPFEKFTLRATVGGGFRIGKNQNKFFDFSLGGYGNVPVNNILPFLGHDYLSLNGNSYVKARFDLDYAFYKKNHLILTANYANVEDNLFGTGKWFSLPQYSGYALGYGLDTFVGPLEVKYSFSPETKEGYWFFSLGFWF